MKTLLLCHKDFVPHKKVKNMDRLDTVLWRTEYYVRESLTRLGYSVKICALENSLQPLKNEIKKFKPDVVFNLLEEFSGEGRLEPFVVSYLESIKQPFTGCNSVGLILAKNKLAAKSILNRAKVRVPGEKKYPKIVKLIDEESSRGITERSVVRNRTEEQKQISKLKRNYSTSVFSEEYILGRELHVAVIIKDGKYLASPIWETTFGKKLGAKIVSEKVKWNFAYRDRMGIELIPAANLSRNLIKKIQNTAEKSCQALEISGYARVDIRLTPSQEIYVLEVNPNPDVGLGDEFAECLRSAGTEYDEMIKTLVLEARSRRS